MNGQEISQMEDPLFATLETWQRENPVRRRINSSDLTKEQGNFVTFTGRFKAVRRPSRCSSRTDTNQNQKGEDGQAEEMCIQLLDQTGLVEVKPTKFIKSETISKVY